MTTQRTKLAGDLLEEVVAMVQDQLPGPPPFPTPQGALEFMAYDIPPEVESAVGFHFPPEVKGD
jgi:hypothetical protein